MDPVDKKSYELSDSDKEEVEYDRVNHIENEKQGSHICSEIPSKEEGGNWFDFEDSLIQSALLGCEECVERLIKAGADVNHTDKFHCTALLKAARHGHTGCVQLLMNAGADVNIPDKFGMPPIGHAVEHWNFSNSMGDTVRRQDKCIEVMLEGIGDDVDGTPDTVETPLMSVASFGNVEWVNSLITAGADMDIMDDYGNTPLMNAASNGHADCLSALIAEGSDVNIINGMRWKPLRGAASCAGHECVKLLVEAGADLKDRMGASFLNVMVMNCSATGYSSEKLGKMFRCTQELFKIGAYINCISGNRYFDQNALRQLVCYSDIHRSQVAMLMLAGGEEVDAEAKERIVRDYLSGEDTFSLKHLSREAVRKQMIESHPHDNLFLAVPKLEIPSILVSYLLYDVSLDDEYQEEDIDELTADSDNDDDDDDN